MLSSIAGKKKFTLRWFKIHKSFYREILGEKARVAEILSAEDQATVLEIMTLAEAEITENPELSYWWSGFRDENDDGQWEWVKSEYFSLL